MLIFLSDLFIDFTARFDSLELPLSFMVILVDVAPFFGFLAFTDFKVIPFPSVSLTETLQALAIDRLLRE